MLPGDFVAKINGFATSGTPFLFILDFDMKEPVAFALNEIPKKILFLTPGFSNFQTDQKPFPTFNFAFEPPTFVDYEKAFNRVKAEIQKGNSYLLNLTFQTPVKTNLSLFQIFCHSKAKYKLLVDDRFVVFSPEIFIEIKDGRISSYPMKGTIDASLPDAANLLFNDEKEIAEHNTIVDLIRNDLSMVSENVMVERFKYLEKIDTHKGALLQMSSRISGELPAGYQKNLGDLILRLLPAGSVTGAPKSKTVSIIREVENYVRGFYTGIFGYFDGENLDSAVMIRFIENIDGQFFFKSGGGITSMSDVQKEYDELIQKIYVPLA
jgi:para-aminobenzoate synthetase component 1